MDDLRERVARIIIDAASNLKDGMPHAEKYAAEAVHDVYRDHLISDEAVERLRELLREAREYVAHGGRSGWTVLLARIDAALATEDRT